MQCGTCVIVSRDPALAEVAGDAAIRADGDKELAEAMGAVAARPELVEEWSRKAAARGLEYSWERTARLTRAVYDEARSRFGN